MRSTTRPAPALFVHLNKLALGKYAEFTPADIKTKFFTAADGTHTSPAGAELNAACVAEGLRELKDQGFQGTRSNEVI